MVGQIHNMFPELSIVWLLFGEGPMEIWKDESTAGRSQSTQSPAFFQSSLFGLEDEANSDERKIVFTSRDEGKAGNLNSNGLKNYQDIVQPTDFKVEKLQNKIKELQSQIDNLKKNPRKVSHITVYYDDSTFETFFPR